MIPGRLRGGTRGSLLALTQTGSVAAALRRKCRGLSVSLLTIKTAGDRNATAPLPRIGGKGLFTKEIEDALLDGRIDFAVHSLKDLPTELPRGLEIGAVLKREDPRDCLIARSRATLKTLPRGARVGTSSLRRQAQIAGLRPDLRAENLRGNLDTRLQKLRRGGYDAIVVARAGLRRLAGKISLKGLRVNILSESEMLPAVGQGALAVEIRSDDRGVREAVRRLNHPPTETRTRAERSFLAVLQGGCQVPVGVSSKIVKGRIVLKGAVVSPDGRRSVRAEVSGPASRPEDAGERLARRLLKSGARKILDAVRG
jgi:hydroxymethylbilane synthase